MQEQLWPSREESAAMNLRRAIVETRGDFVVEWIERGEKGYFVLFRRGSVVHREPDIEIAVLEQGAHRDEIRAGADGTASARDEIRELVERVKSVFDRR